MLFADVRGSTTLAERLGAFEFSKLMNRFYTTATEVFVQSDALVDCLIGDEAIGLEHSQPELKGKSEPIGVRTVRVSGD